MLVAAAGTGVWVSDGATNVLRVGDGVPAAWAQHHRLVLRALARGFAQGWDLHPGHLVTRWLALLGFSRAALEPTLRRLHSYLDRQDNGVLEEPATAQALAAVLLRGLDVGAFDEAEVGLQRAALQGILARSATPGGGADGG